MPTIDNLEPWAVGNGPYHPAVKMKDGPVWFWPNIIYNTGDEAYDAAKALFMDAVLAAQTVINSWNLSTY